MKILVTNDDGITSPGIHALAHALTNVGDVVVVAPDKNWSISGHQKTLGRFLRADPYPQFPHTDIPAYASSGAPADCVALAMMGLLETPPDIVVSGINRGANLGQDITYSGTVAATLEAAIFGIPAVAVSLDDRSDSANFARAAPIAAEVVQKVLVEGLPFHTLLNVNFPHTPASTWQGLRVTCLGRRRYEDDLVKGEDPSGKPWYWIKGVEPAGETDDPDTDIGAVYHGYVSVTPIQLDMTEHALRQTIKGWF
jgi:5'-nucleotidase